VVFEFRLPDIGEGVAEGEVVQWFVKEGDTILEDAPLVSVLTDKANVEIPSPKAGRVAKIHASVGQKVKVGGLLVTIEGVGESTSLSGPSETGANPPNARAGTAPVPSALAGAPPPAPRAAPSSSTPPPTPGSGLGRVLASPYLRRLAAERGIDLSQVRGTGPEGRITEADLGASATSPTTAVRGSPSDRPASAGAVPTMTSPESEVRERVPIRGIRRVIAEHMSEAVHRAAHFTYVEEIDASELVRLRDHMSKHVEKQGARLSYLPFIVKGVVAGLKAHPRLNALMDDARGELVVQSGYHIGIATATPDGLIVPVLRRADTKSLTAIAREIQDLAERGRAGTLRREELVGSTFTITSLGALGGVLATPILNYPQVAILGVHKITRRPMYRPDGTIGPSDLMNLSISIDHRALDGFDAAQFIATVKSYLEDPHQLFAELA